MILKTGICVAYDWHFLQQSLPSIYKHVDAICLSVDAERRSWNGNSFLMDWDAFTEMVNDIDTQKKIQILQEPFYCKARTPIENECYQRKRMADVLGKADWIIQVDTDEIIINTEDFLKELSKHNGSKRSVNIHGIWINLIKQTESGFIYSVVKTPPLATNSPQYDYGRTNGNFSIYTNTFLAHITWARPEEEVYYKLKNWGHSHEFNGMSFFKIWQALDDFNWRYLKDFHPMNKSSIPKLYFQKALSFQEFITNISLNQHYFKKGQLALNNIWVSRFNKLLRKIK